QSEQTLGALLEQARRPARSDLAFRPSCVRPVASCTWMRMVATSTLPPGGIVMPAGLSETTTESVPDAAHDTTFAFFSTQPVAPAGTKRSLPGTWLVHSGPSSARKTVTAPLSFAATGSTPSAKSD